ncbi:hypothetical protein [Microbacterium hominis]|uniref:hypothetical protein n=1 Tax=Microbacterium hominis TaxID=162426 RepID=UPI0007685CC8|nr:hypothetical protein [Microbacterium hominis]KXC05181.1 hypothetical protein MhomT_12440 [Microbacterium hominis]
MSTKTAVRGDDEAVIEEQEQIVRGKGAAVGAMHAAIMRSYGRMGARPGFDRFREDVIDRFLRSLSDDSLPF